MAHEIESIAYTGTTPWHKLGTYLPEPMDSQTAITAAGLDWTVSRRKLYAGEEENDEVYNVSDVETHRAIVRDGDNAVLGVVGKRYVPVQNHEAFGFMDALVEDGDLRYHTAGSLRGGKRVWMLAQFGRTEVVPDDMVDKFLFLWNTHDGSGALRCLFTNVRVVCANTARMALDSGVGDGIYLRHTANINARLEASRKVLGLAQKESEKFDEFAGALVKLKMTDDMWKEYANTLIPDSDSETKAAITRIGNQRDKLATLYTMGRGQEIQGVERTGWAAYSAVTEFANYHRTTRGGKVAQERRFESSLFGTGAQLVATATDKLTEFLKAA